MEKKSTLYLLLVTFLFLPACFIGKSSTHVEFFGFNAKTDVMCVGNYEVTGLDNREVEQKVEDITGKHFLRPECGYPTSIGMVGGDQWSAKVKTDFEHLLFARHPKYRLWYKVRSFNPACSYISITRPREDSISVKLCYKNEEWDYGFKWTEATSVKVAHWEMYCSKECGKKKRV